MFINKQVRKKSTTPIQRRNSGPFVCFRPYNHALFVNCEVRDAILPHKRVAIEILENGDFIIHPTDDAKQYAVSITAGMTLISGNLFCSKYKHGIRIPAEIMKNGTILCMANKGGAIT